MMDRGRLYLLAILASVAVGCEFPITSETEQAWQRNFPQALFPGYKGFKGLFVDSDTAVYIFSYEVPKESGATGVLPVLRAQVASRNACYTVTQELATELQMRCATSSRGTTGFDEFRFLFDPQRWRVTVMVGNFDSPVEQEGYPYLAEELRRLHSPQ